MVVYYKEMLINELPKHRSLFWKIDCFNGQAAFCKLTKFFLLSYFVISVKYYNDQITTLTDMYCLYRLDVIIPGATIKPQSQKSVHNMTTSVDDTEPFDYTTVDVPAVKTSRQDGVGVTWDKPHKDENIDSVSSWLMLIIALTAKSVFTQTLQLT